MTSVEASGEVITGNKKEATTENKWATEKMKEKKEGKPFGNFMWEEEYMGKGAVNPTEQNLLKRMRNKHVEGAWRFFLE